METCLREENGRKETGTLYILNTGEVRAVFYDEIACSSTSFIRYERRSQEKEFSCLSIESTPKSYAYLCDNINLFKNPKFKITLLLLVVMVVRKPGFSCKYAWDLCKCCTWPPLVI